MEYIENTSGENKEETIFSSYDFEADSDDDFEEESEEDTPTFDEKEVLEDQLAVKAGRSWRRKRHFPVLEMIEALSGGD